MLIGGQWVSAEADATFASSNPATGAVLGYAPAAGAAETTRAVDAAHHAFAGWSRRPAAERGRILTAVADLLLERRDLLAELITAEEGKPLRDARNEIAASADLLRWYAEEGRRAYGRWIPDPLGDRRLFTVRRPVGVTAAITPWNVPASMIARKAAPALAAGCTVVVKPAEQTPLTGLAVARVFHDAGVPAGVFNLVTGPPAPIGRALLGDPRVRKLSFTGSTEVGRHLMREAAQQITRVSLELGGNAPFLVFADADLDAAVESLISAKFRNCGQACISANRVLVQRSIAGDLTERLADVAGRLRVGDGFDEATQVGPLVDDAALRRVEQVVDAAVADGARVVAGGRRLSGPEHAAGNFFAPTVLTGVRPGMSVVDEEIFGPVAPVLVFDSEDEAVSAANATPYGLAAYLYTRDLGRALRVAERLDVGLVGINDQRISAAEAPFGGVKLSGIGREGGSEGLDEHLETTVIAVGLAG